jgi:hypothetical protein
MNAICIAVLSVLHCGPAAADDPPPDRTLIIIAPRKFEPALRPYVEHKRRHMRARLVALESILKNEPGVDDPERLKRALYREWKTRGAAFALLVGDADVLPVRYMVLDRVTPPAFDYAFYPSDLYYADVAKSDGRFDDWNAQHDDFHAEYFGEVRGEKNKTDPINFDQIDYRPEIAVGRWPVSTPEEVGTLVAKSIAYEKAVTGDAKQFARAAFITVGGWIDARHQMDRMAAHLPRSWSREKRYYRDGPAKKAPPPDEDNVIALLNDGVGLMLHAGHGSDDRWEGSLSVAGLARVKNAGRLGVLMSAGCSTARFATLPPYEGYIDIEGKEHAGTNNGDVFDKPPPAPAPYQNGKYNFTGLGEQLLRAGPHGAVAYFGCNTGGQPCGVTLLEGFVDTLASSSRPTIGECWQGAVSYYVEREKLAELKPNEDWYPPSIFFQGMKYMLFGDPSLPMADLGLEKPRAVEDKTRSASQK